MVYTLCTYTTTIIIILSCYCVLSIGVHRGQSTLVQPQATSHNPANQSNPTNLSTINEDSIENADHSATGDGSHVEGVEGEGVRSEGGVGRSVSDQGLRRNEQHNGEHCPCFNCLL